MYLGMTVYESEPSKAIDACKKATELKPADSFAWFILGLTYESQKEFRLRYRLFSELCKLDRISLRLGRP